MKTTVQNEQWMGVEVSPERDHRFTRRVSQSVVLTSLLRSVAALLQTFVDGQQKERINFQASGPNTGLEIMGQSLYIGGLPDSFPLNRFTQKSVPPFLVSLW